MPVRLRHRPVRTATLVAVGSVGVVVLVVAATLLAHRRTLPASFDVAAAPVPATFAARVPASTSPPSRTTAASPTTAAPPTAEPVVTDPVSLRLAAFAVTAPVVPVTSAAGRLDPPDDPAQVGWWLASAPAGAATGTTVLVGHVDGPSGPGALYRLVHSRAGDTVTVAGSNGLGVDYVVTSLQYVAKADRLPADLFAQTGAPRLVLVSCGGSFDRATDEYTDNVVVTATPA